MVDRELVALKRALEEILEEASKSKGQTLFDDTSIYYPEFEKYGIGTKESLDKRMKFIEQKREEYIDKVRFTIFKLHHDLYGKCEKCGREINKIHLKANPLKAKCQMCETLHEATAVQ